MFFTGNGANRPKTGRRETIETVMVKNAAKPAHLSTPKIHVQSFFGIGDRRRRSNALNRKL